MSVSGGFGLNGTKLYTNICKPIDVSLNFIIDSTNGNGLGLRSLKSNGYVKSVYMHTSASPATGSPNPLAGYALIQFNNNFNKYIGGFSGFVSPSTGAPILIDASDANLVLGTPYIIAVLGTSTTADWQAIGLPQGLTPTVGQSFIAIATGAGTGTGSVVAAGSSGIDSIEVIGNPNASIANSNSGMNGGAYLLVQFLAAGTPTAPANGSVVGMTCRFDGSSVTIDGL